MEYRYYMNIKTKYDNTAINAKLDAKVKRLREKKQFRVEDWKDRLALRVLNGTPDHHHEDLLDAMLEIAIDTLMRRLGGESAISIIDLVIKQRVKTLRGKLN